MIKKRNDCLYKQKGDYCTTSLKIYGKCFVLIPVGWTCNVIFSFLVKLILLVTEKKKKCNMVL